MRTLSLQASLLRTYNSGLHALQSRLKPGAALIGQWLVCSDKFITLSTEAAAEGGRAVRWSVKLKVFHDCFDDFMMFNGRLVRAGSRYFLILIARTRLNLCVQVIPKGLVLFSSLFFLFGRIQGDFVFAPLVSVPVFKGGLLRSL